MPASSAATEMTNTGASSGTFSLRRAIRATTLRSGPAERRGDLRPRVGGLRGGELLQRLAGVAVEPCRHGHLDRHQQVALLGPGADAAAADPEGAAGRG